MVFTQLEWTIVTYVGGIIMSDKKYYTILMIILILGVISTVALTVYTAQLYDKCSIISYIANEPF